MQFRAVFSKEKTVNKSIINRLAKSVHARGITAAGLLTMLGTQAHAALPVGVSDAIEAAQTDMLAAIGLVIGAMVAVWGLLKLASKLGWR